jgi:hypothetical protein
VHDSCVLIFKYKIGNCFLHVSHITFLCRKDIKLKIQGLMKCIAEWMWMEDNYIVCESVGAHHIICGITLEPCISCGQ